MKHLAISSWLYRGLTLVALVSLLIPAVQAQTPITKFIRIIVPYGPGGTTDALARLIAPYVGDEFGQQAVVENRPGAGSTIGTLDGAKAEPDGLTIGMIAPLGTPDDYVKRVNAAVNRALKTPELQAKLKQQGFVTVGGSPREFATWIPAEITKWAQIIKDANIKTE